MADMKVSLKLLADGSVLVGEIRLARAELAQLHSAANDAGAGLRSIGAGGAVTGVTQTRHAVTGLTGDMTAAAAQAAGAQTAARGLSTDMARVGTAATAAGAGVAATSTRMQALGRAANDAGAGLSAASVAAARHGAALGGASEAAGGAFGAIRALTGGIGGLIGAVASLGATQLVEWLIPVQTQAEATERRLTALTGGGAALADSQRWLSATAQRLGADLKALTESYAGLLPMQRAGILSTQQARDLTEGLRAAQLRYGASTEAMSNVSYGLGQALASPILHLEELAQVTEPLPGLLLDLDKAAGLPAGGFRKLADQGKVTAGVFRDTLLKALKSYAADAAAAAQGTEAELTRLGNAWERLKKLMAPPVAAATTVASGAATAMMNRVADNWEAGNRQAVENQLALAQAELSAALDKHADLEAELARYRSGAGGVFAKKNAANAEKQIASVTTDIDAILDRLGKLAKQLPAVEDGWAAMWGVAETGGRSAADELRGPLEAAAEAAGLVVTKNGLLTKSEQEMATHIGTLTKVLALAPAELKKLGLSAADVAVIMGQLQEKLDPVAATVLRLNTAAATLAVAPKYRSLYETLDQGEKEKGRPLTDNEAASLTQGWSAKRKADSTEQVRLTREAADAAVRLGQAQASGNPAAVAQAKAQMDVAKALRDGVITQADKAAYYQSRLAEEMAAVNGQAGAAATGLSVQARQARELAAATREGGAAAWEAATRHKVENETRQAGAGLSSELAARVRDEAEAQRELAQAQWDRDLDAQIAAAEALAAAEGAGAEAVALATIAVQAAAQAEKEGVAADSERAKAIGAKTRALIEWQQRQSMAAAGRQADDDLVLLQAEIRLQGEGASVRERTLYLLREEQAIRREFPLLSEQERQGLLAKKALLYDTGAALKEQQALYEAIGAGLGQAFDRVGSAITEAFAQGKVSALNFRDIGRATLSELIQIALRLAAINPIKNWLTGGSEASLWSALASGGGATATGQTAGAGSAVTGSLTNAATSTALSKAGSWAVDKVVPGGLMGSIDAWAYSNLGIGSATYGAPVVASNGMLAGGGATSLATPTGITGGLSAYLGAAGAGAFGGGLLGGWAGTAANSKAAGAGVGAAAGAGSAYLASIMGMSSIGGPIGLAIGAVVGGIMGALGTSKTPAGPGAAIDYVYGRDGARDYQTYTRKGETDERVKAIGETLAGTLDLLRQAGGSLNGPISWHYGYNQRDGVGTDVNGRYFSSEADPDKWAQAVLRQLRDEGSLSFGDAPALVKKAFDGALATPGNSLEDVVKGVALAKSIADATAGLDGVDKSFQALAASAKTTAAAQYDAVKVELEVAKKAGIADEYRGLVERQLRAAFDPAVTATQTVSSTGAALAALDGEMQALADAVTALGLSISGAEIEAWRAAKVTAMQRQYDAGLTASLNTARGRDYLNQADAVAATLKATRQEINDLYASVADRDSRWATAVEINRVAAQKVIDDNGLTGGGLQEFVKTFASALAEAGVAAGDVAQLTNGLHESTAAVEAQAQAQEDLQQRLLAARVAAGTATQAQLDAYETETARRRELAAATNDTTRAVLGEIYATQDAAKARAAQDAAVTALTERWQSATASRTNSGGVAGLNAALIAAQDQYAADAAVDGAKAMDILRASVTALVDGLSDSDATLAATLRMSSAVSGTAAQALADALAARQAATQEAAWTTRQSEATEVLAARVTTARGAYLDALTREQATLRDTASRLREVGASLSSLRASLALDSTLSPLSAQARLAEAKRQLQAAVDEFRSTGSADAGTKAQQLMDSYLRASRDYNASAPAYQADYDWVIGLTSELEGLATTTADAKDAQARALDATVAALGGTTSAVLSLTDALARYTEAVRLSGGGAGAQDFGNADVANDNRVVAAATIQSGNGYTGAFRDGAFATWAQSTYAAHANDQGVSASVNAMLRASTGYTGDFRDGAFLDYVRSGAVTELQREAARSILRRNDVVPQFEQGGWHGGGARIVGERGIELEVTGAARYYSHEQTRDLLSPRPAPDLTPLVSAVNANAITISRAVTASGEAVTLAIGQLAAEVAGMRQELADSRREVRDLTRIVGRLAA